MADATHQCRICQGASNEAKTAVVSSTSPLDIRDPHYLHKPAINPKGDITGPIVTVKNGQELPVDLYGYDQCLTLVNLGLATWKQA